MLNVLEDTGGLQEIVEPSFKSDLESGPGEADTCSKPKTTGPAKWQAAKNKVVPAPEEAPVLSAMVMSAKSVDAFSEWNDLLAGVGFGDTMERLSSYYQNNAILAGLLATIVFANMASARLFDLNYGTTTCPVSGDGICVASLPMFTKQQLEVTHFIFYIAGYICLIVLLCIIIVCVMADNTLKRISVEEELKAFMTTFSFVGEWVDFFIKTAVACLGAHFGALILIHMYFALWAYILVGSSSTVVVVILIMQRKAAVFSRERRRVRLEKRRMEAALSTARSKKKPLADGTRNKVNGEAGERTLRREKSSDRAESEA